MYKFKLSTGVWQSFVSPSKQTKKKKKSCPIFVRHTGKTGRDQRKIRETGENLHVIAFHWQDSSSLNTGSFKIIFPEQSKCAIIKFFILLSVPYQQKLPVLIIKENDINQQNCL